MLEEIKVDGFKSLRNFTFEIRPGLNVFVGPNGAGKSNIILFFEFLSHLCNGTAMYATSRVGGAGAIFSMMGKGKLQSELSFSLRGRFELKGRRSRSDAMQLFNYEYKATIELIEELSTLGFSVQELAIKGLRNETGQSEDIFYLKWHCVGAVNAVEKFKIHDGFIDQMAFLFSEMEKQKKDDWFDSRFSAELRDYSILNLLSRIFEPIDFIRDDLTQGRAYNIDPNRVRQLEDIATEPGINFDGSGLAATLYRLKATTHNRDRRMTPLRNRIMSTYPRNLLSRVEKYSQLVNHNVQSIDVESDPFENKIKLSLVMKPTKDNLEDIKVPISLASDGMVKWLALTTAILSSRSAFSIEEPENFLHPFMQKEIVEIVREQCNSRKGSMFALITTHSETLINALDPTEIIVVCMGDGITHVCRPSNTEELNEQISETGFGLGFYYLAGALQ